MTIIISGNGAAIPKPIYIIIRSLFLIVSCLFLVTQVHAGDMQSATTPSVIPKGEIEVGPEAVAPAWQLIWDRARDMARQGELEGAVALYGKLLSERPGLVEARLELATILIDLGRDKRALLELKKVNEERPDRPRVLYLMARVLERTKNYSKAVEIYNELLELDKTNETALSEVGVNKALVELGLYHCLKALGKKRLALPHLIRAVAKRPQDKKLQLWLAYDLLDIGRCSKALPFLESLFPEEKDSPEFVKRYIKAIQTCGKIRVAKHILQKIVEAIEVAGKPFPTGWNRHDMCWALETLYDLYLADGQSQKALSLLEHVERTHPEFLTPRLLEALGRLYFGDKRFIRSIDIFTTLALRDPDNADAHIFLARAYERLQLISKAASEYQEAFILTKNLGYLEKALGLLVRSGQTDKASRLLDRVARPTRLSYDKTSFSICISQGDLNGALQVLYVNPRLWKDQEVLRGLCALLFQAHSLNKGKNRPDKVLVQRVVSGLIEGEAQNRPYIRWAVEQIKITGLDELYQHILYTINEYDGHLWAVLRLSHYLEDKEDDEQALEVLDKWPGETDARLDAERLRLLLELGETEEANKIIELLLRWREKGLRKNWVDEQIALGRIKIHESRQHYKEGFKLLEGLFNRYPNHLEAHKINARLLGYYGLWPQAIWEGLGVMLISANSFCPIDIERLSPGLIFIKGSAQLPMPDKLITSDICKGGSQACQILLSLSYEKTGQDKEAIASWEFCLKRCRDYWPGYQHLARLYTRTGSEDKAKELIDSVCSQLEKTAHSSAQAPDLVRWFEIGPSREMWDELQKQAIVDWKHVLCSP